jgi:hypothetical protein
MSTANDIEPRDLANLDEGHSAAEAFNRVADRWQAEDAALGLPSDYPAITMLRSTSDVDDEDSIADVPAVLELEDLGPVLGDEPTPRRASKGKTPRHLLASARADIERLWSEAIEEGPRALFLVTVAKPLAPDAGRSPHHQAARRRALKKAADGGPIVALLGIKVVLALLGGVKSAPGVAAIVQRLTADRDLTMVQIVVATGSTFELVELPRTTPINDPRPTGVAS